jgi:hypothetical protein
MIATANPSPFSLANPKLQTAWDSSSLGAIQFCPRYYQYTILEGWKGSQVDLEFGGFAASGFELYQKRRLAGDTKEQATLAVVRQTLIDTWNADGTQWGGHFEDQWHCTGEKPYKNAKGNHAKCPYSHKGAWFPKPAPDLCGTCGSPIETVRNYIPGHAAKNRVNLVRMLIWYIDEQPEDLNDGLRPYVFPDGTPAVELSVRLPTPWKSSHGDDYILTGHFDYIGVFGEENWIVDNKTTTKTLGDKFWQGYSPHYQLDTYDLFGSLMFPDLELKGVLIDAAQVTGTKDPAFARHTFRKTEEMREEHWRNIEFWIKQAEAFAEADYWPMNKRQCFLCPFNSICNKDPLMREGYLRGSFKQGERWNPLAERTASPETGEI